MFSKVPVFPQHGSLWGIQEALKLNNKKNHPEISRTAVEDKISLHNFIFPYLINNVYTAEITSPVLSFSFCIHALNLTFLFHVCKCLLKHIVSDETAFLKKSFLYISIFTNTKTRCFQVLKCRISLSYLACLIYHFCVFLQFWEPARIWIVWCVFLPNFADSGALYEVGINIHVLGA